MSEGDVSLIRDEDLLRRMWQQTEDFSRKKEIRAHMYRLREERLRNLYSPEPPAAEGKGCEFTSAQGHVKSFADQTFQSMKSKEVRDAGSPPKEFTYRGQDLKELSNAGWNVESENRKTDDGHTHVKTLQANIEGQYDVEGGRGQFAAIDKHQQAVTEYHDDNSSLKRNESSSNTAAHEQVVQQSDDGSKFSSTTCSTTSTSKFQQVSSTKHEKVPYLLTNDDYDQPRQKSYNTNRNEEVASYNINRNEEVVTKKEGTYDHDQNLKRSDLEGGELMSRKVEYPDDNTKIVVETRLLPDGTRVTSTRREFRVPVDQSSRHEHNSQQTKSESKSYHTSTQQTSNIKESTSNVTQQKIDNSLNIVDSQKTTDDYDFKRNLQNRYFTTEDDTYESTQRTDKQRYVSNIDEHNKNEITTQNLQRQNIKEYDQTRNTEEREQLIKTTRENKTEELVDKKTISDQYQTTYTADYSQKKISNDWSPTHQAWASTLRADTPTSIRPSTRSSSPGGRTFQSSTSSLRSSVSPDKTCRKPSSRGGSPNKVDRYSPTRTVSDRYSSTNSTHSVTETKTNRYTSPDGRPPHGRSPTRPSYSPEKMPQRKSLSPEKKSQDHIHKYSTSPDRNSVHETSPNASPNDDVSRKPDDHPRQSPSPDRRPASNNQPRGVSPNKRSNISPEKVRQTSPTKDFSPTNYPHESVPHKYPGQLLNYPRDNSPTMPYPVDNTQKRLSTSPDRNHWYQPNTDGPRDTSRQPSTSPDRKPRDQPSPAVPRETSRQPSTSPNRKPGYQPGTDVLKETFRQPSTSPDRKPSYQPSTDGSRYTSRQPSMSPDRKPRDQPSTSPNRKPGYMRPTVASSNISDVSNSTFIKSPNSPEIKSPLKETRSYIHENKVTKVKEDHYKFIDEETKMYSQTDIVSKYERQHGKSPSPMKKTPSEDNSITNPQTQDTPRSTLRKQSRSPSPPKGPVTFTQDSTHKIETIETNTTTNSEDITRQTFNKCSPSKMKDFTLPRDLPKTFKKPQNKECFETPKDSSTTIRSCPKAVTEPRDRDSPVKLNKGSPATVEESPTSVKGLPKTVREPHDKEHSPPKYGTYDKKQHHFEETNKDMNVLTTDINYDSITRQVKSPKKTTEHLDSPKSKIERDSVSPVKSVSRNTKYSTTTDFISTEKTNEEINKKTAHKDRPRQLITPSTSPTRKPKTDDTAPSTGQSSPTTSVSGFVYYGSPCTEKTIVTDLDEQDSYSETKETEEINITFKRPSNLNVNRSPSPSKIPCRSPSPEKRHSPTIDNLPRKSSLKKPSSSVNQASPIEKPPSNFCVSPTAENQSNPDHRIVKKDKLEKTDKDTPIKTKPPLERRETYEERCRKILGMMDDTMNKTLNKKIKEPTSNSSSTSVTPCGSPTTNEDLLFNYKNNKQTKTSESDITDFIPREREELTITSRQTNAPKSTKNTHSRDSSPTKLQDIISETGKSYETSTNECKLKDITISKIVTEDNVVQKKIVKRIDDKISRPSISPEKKKSNDNDHPFDKHSQSPDRKHNHPENVKRDRSVSPSKSQIKPHSSPDHKIKGSTSENPGKTLHSVNQLENLKSSKIKRQETYNVEESKLTNKATMPRDKSNSPTRGDLKEPSPTKNIPYNKESVTNVSPDKKHYTVNQSDHVKSSTIVRQETYDVEESKIPHEIIKSRDKSLSPMRKDNKAPALSKNTQDKLHTKQSSSPDHKPKGPTSTTLKKTEELVNQSEHLTSSTITKQEYKDIEESQLQNKIAVSRKTKSPSPTRKHVNTPSSGNPQELRQLRTPSPSKKSTIISEKTEELLVSEREQEILDRVQKSLRRLSPDRNEKSPSREKSPTSLQDIDISTTSEYVDASSEMYDHTSIDTEFDDNLGETGKKIKDQTDQKLPSKPSSRNVSPVKKTTTIISPMKSKTEVPNKSRSISPKKSATLGESSQSPQAPKTSGIKPREPVQSYNNKKPSAPIKNEKVVVTAETKKTGITKQNSLTKISTTKIVSKNTQSIPQKSTEPESKFKTPKTNVRDININRKEPDTRVTRTASDISIKTKKSSPQRMKSKPEIQVSEINTSKTTRITSSTTTRLQKPNTQTKLPSKPKSATALNTSTDEDDVIIDVEQAKSSRENSPDRICPTPVNFAEDISTPRYPDEINEPDDEFRRRTHNTIHEAESIVDDIVEICEDEELFIRNTDKNRLTELDESLLSVNDKVSKFTDKIDTMSKTKDTSKQFQETEKKVHSDFIDDNNLKSDECLLSVSEKVNKFAKGPKHTQDSRSPSRKIVNELDKNTIYQDDYTKLSVNDKAHLFIETAENTMTPKYKVSTRVERPDFTDVDESLKTDDCLLSVSDKVNKFVKTAEQFLTQSHETEEKEKKIKEQHDFIMKKLVENIDNNVFDSKEHVVNEIQTLENKDHDYKNNLNREEKRGSFSKETTSSHAKIKDHPSPNLKLTEKTPTIKITTLRSSEAVKKAKALFENIASTQKTKDTTQTKTTKLTDIGVMKKSPKTDSTIVLHPSLEDGCLNLTDVDSEIDAVPQRPPSRGRPLSKTPTRQQPPRVCDEKQRTSPSRLTIQSPEVPRTKSPMRQTIETTTEFKSVSSRYPSQRPESPNLSHPEHDKNSQDKVPGYQRPTKTSQMKEEIKSVEETEVSSRRGSGKFGVELRRTSVERSTVSSERRRSVEHHQPCIEDIYDLDLLEQMLEKVVGYEQRRRIRAQIRVAKKKMETNTDTYTKTAKHSTLTVTNTKSPEQHYHAKSPDRHPKTTVQKTVPDRTQPKETVVLNGHTKEPKVVHEPRQRLYSPEKLTSKVPAKIRSPVRQPSPEKKTRTTSPSKTATKLKSNRFNEYASAYLKKAGLNDTEKVKFSENKIKKIAEVSDTKTVNQEEHKVIESKSIVSKSYTERKSSKDTINVTHVNGKRTPSPEKKRSPERKVEIPTERLREKSPSPVLKRQISDTGKKESFAKSVYDAEKKSQPKQMQEDKPSWVTNRNLKKISTETRTFSSKKIESEKPKYRPSSPSKVISKPTDVITSSYGPGPLDADGKPLFGIRALRNGASRNSNYQVKGTVIRQEFHSRNGGEPEGSVSVTAYSSSPEELERLLQVQGERPSRLHGLAAITTTKKFGGDTGNSYKDVHTKEERAVLDQFTHSNRRVVDSRVEITDVTRDSRDQETRHEQRMTEDRQERQHSQERLEKQERLTKQERFLKQDRQEKQERPQQKVEERREKTQRIERREDKKTVRQSSVKSLTEKFIKNASETSKTERSTYPKAGLILRTTSMRDSVSSDSSAHAGLARTDSEHSLGSVEDTVVSSTTERDGRTVTSTTRTHKHTRSVPAHTQERSFLDSSTKVTGVQDILTRMKNADIVIQEGDSMEDTEARALLNKFLGATVLMAGMQNYVTDKGGQVHVKKETVRTSGGKVTSSVEEFDLDQCWDERLLRKLLDECNDYEQRRRLRARIRTLMAEQEACASAVTEALAASGETADGGDEAREKEEVTTVTSSVRRNSSEKTISSSTTTKSTKVIESMNRSAPKPVSPFAKFRQLEKQNSTNSPNSPKTPQSPGSAGPQSYFKFTDPALQASALTIKERLLQWCRDKTRDYENVKLENFSTSWADGLAFCALVHHFLPNTFDYSKLTPDKRRHNFTLAFKVADEKAGIYPLLDVDDMVAMRKPDWKCVFTYVQSIHRRFKDQN